MQLTPPILDLLSPAPGGPGADLFGAGVGAAAVLLVAGWAVTRWQRDRMRFALMRDALEKGITHFPGTPPYWLLSLRYGVSLLVVGLGLMAAGGLAWRMGAAVPAPDRRAEAAAVQPAGAPTPVPTEPAAAPEPVPVPPAPPAAQPGPGTTAPKPPKPPHPPKPDPEMERWQRAQAQETVGLVSAATGLILALLGLVRVFFARLERAAAEWPVGESGREAPDLPGP